MKYLPIVTLSLLALAPAIQAQGNGCCQAEHGHTACANSAYAGFDCVTLLDSTAVSVQSTGSGSFAVYKNSRCKLQQEVSPTTSSSMTMTH